MRARCSPPSSRAIRCDLAFESRPAVLPRTTSDTWIWPAWLSLCGVLMAFAAALLVFGDHFDWQRSLRDLPTRQLAAGLVVAGLCYSALLPLIYWTTRAGASQQPGLIALVLLSGLAMRLILLPSVPALEDDFYRYLWDGAVTAAGLNPYAFAPASAAAGEVSPAVDQLARDGALVLDRVNHSELKTIYPPVAQAAFALAHWIEPWSLRSWRLVCLLGECASAALILGLLAAIGRSPLWLALYWLNPLVTKELINSAHMEAIVLPLVLATVLLLVRHRPLWATLMLGLAIGAKLWPIMLLPLALRPLLGTPLRLVAAVGMLCLFALAWALPPWLGGLGSDSGFIAYATRWQTNSALFQLLQELTRSALGGFNIAEHVPGMLVRLSSAAVVASLAVWLAWRPAVTPHEVISRAALIVLALFLLSPAQFPWYACWILIFAPLMPWLTHLGVTVFVPLYYAAFYLIGWEQYARLNPWLIGLEWLPIWILLFFDARAAWRRPLVVDLGMGGSRHT